MRSRAERDRTPADRGTPRPGHRRARLSEARKQLAIVLEDVDLAAEPELAEAVVDAVSAAARADGLADDGEVVNRRSDGRAGSRTGGPAGGVGDGTSPASEGTGFAWQAEAE